MCLSLEREYITEKVILVSRIQRFYSSVTESFPPRHVTLLCVWVVSHVWKERTAFILRGRQLEVLTSVLKWLRYLAIYCQQVSLHSWLHFVALRREEVFNLFLMTWEEKAFDIFTAVIIHLMAFWLWDRSFWNVSTRVSEERTDTTGRQLLLLTTVLQVFIRTCFFLL